MSSLGGEEDEPADEVSIERGREGETHWRGLTRQSCLSAV